MVHVAPSSSGRLGALLALVVVLMLGIPTSALARSSDDAAAPSVVPTPLPPASSVQGPVAQGVTLGSLISQHPSGRSFPDPFSYDDVLLVENQNSPMSLAIGSYFAQKRDVPPSNIVLVDVPDQETVTDIDANAAYQTIRDHLIDNDLVDQIRFIVTTKGVPLRYYKSTDGGNRASFDSDLAILIGSHNTSIGGSSRIPNPYYGENATFTHAAYDMYLVTRLVAYNQSTALALVDRADNATANLGLFELDVDPNRDGGGYGIANDWLRNANDILTDWGYQTELDETSTYLNYRQNVTGYASWGSNDCCAPNHAKPRNSWLPGAIAETYVSTGGRTFDWSPEQAGPNYTGQSLVADWIDEGVTGVKGYVYEPYLDAMSQPDILFPRYVSGYTLAESYYMGSQWLSWMDVVVGDPKVAPYFDDPDLVVTGFNVSTTDVSIGETVTVQVEVANLGGIASSGGELVLSTGLLPGDEELATVPLPDLQPLEATLIDIPLTADLAGPLPLFAQVSLGVTERFADNNDASLTLQVLTQPDLGLTIEDFEDSPLQGEVIDLPLRVSNIGGASTNMSLRVLLPGAATSQLVTTAVVASGGNLLATYSFNTSEYAGDLCLRFDVTATRPEVETADNVVEVCLFVHTFAADATIAPLPPILPPLPVLGTINLTNSGNTLDTFELQVVLLDDSGLWSAVVAPSQLDIAANTTQSAQLTLTPPLMALAGSHVNGTILVTTQGGDQTFVLPFVGSVAQAPALRFSTGQSEAVVTPGEPLQLSASLRNEGNMPLEVELQADGTDDIAISLLGTSGPRTLAPATALPLQLQLRSTPLARGGSVSQPQIRAQVLTPNVTLPASLVLTIEVEEVHGFAAEFDGGVVGVDPATGANLSLQLANLGNVVSAYRIEGALSSLPQEITVEANSNVTIALAVAAHDLPDTKEQEIPISVIDLTERTVPTQRVTAHARLQAFVLSLDLTTTDIKRGVIGGERTTVSLTVDVRNDGSIASPPLVLRLTLPGTSAPSRLEVSSIPPQSKAAGVVISGATDHKGQWTLELLDAASETTYVDPLRGPVGAPRASALGPDLGGSGLSASLLVGIVGLLAAAAVALLVVLTRRRLGRDRARPTTLPPATAPVDLAPVAIQSSAAPAAEAPAHRAEDASVPAPRPAPGENGSGPSVGAPSPPAVTPEPIEDDGWGLPPS